MERWSTQWAHERITQWQREQPLSAHRHGYDREMLREGIVQVCVKPYRARHRRFTDERALERKSMLVSELTFPFRLNEVLMMSENKLQHELSTYRTSIAPYVNDAK